MVPRGLWPRRNGPIGGSTKPASFAGFETEDVLYLIAPIAWLGWLSPFLIAAVAGAPAFALFTLWEIRKARAGE